MNIVNPLRLTLVVGVLALGAGAPVVAAQTEVVAPPSPDADALTVEMRALVANPNDLNALINAGELALKLGDPTAAARFFARADKIDPRNARLKAGTARTLLVLERPGEALRLFGEAERLGYEPVHYVAERALAFDLVGEQERAQRDYRLALKQGPDDETTRRYALSLGISGRKDQALAQIDTLLRKSDRAAWRVRAFVLAMSGDVAGAEKIATSMLPAGMAGGLIPFFARLPSLGAADRAFAVHFGEVGPTPARVADARLTPSYAPLAPEPLPPVRVAANDAAAKDPKADRRNRRRRDRPVEVAAVAIPPVVRRPVPTPPPQPSRSPPARILEKAPVPTPQPVAPSSPPPKPDRVTVIVAQKAPVVVLPVAERPAVVQTATRAAADYSAVDLPSTVAVATTLPASKPTQAPVPAPTPPAAEVVNLALVPAERQSEISATASELAVASPAPAPATTAALTPTPSASLTAPPATVAIERTGPSPAPDLAPTASPAPVRPVASEESILSRIVATISVPAAELGIPRVVPTVGKAVATPTPTIHPSAEETKALARAAEKKLADKKLADRKLAEKQAAAKLAAEEAAAAKKALKAESSRIWVQVAGGANVADLPKEWTRLRGKAGALLQNRQAWTTPLRFTNRLLTGPFKSGDEAQGFVNTIAKSGITGFVFTSDPGQKVARLSGK